MKFTERFWTETIPRLTDVSVAALLHALHTAPDSLPRGVIRSGVGHWSNTRYAWAASHIDAELSVAPGIVVDPRAELACVWEVATSEIPPGIHPARAWGRKIALVQASFAGEIANRMQANMGGATRESFHEGLKEGKMKISKKPTPMPQRPPADPFEPLLASLKQYERLLRAELGAEDIGNVASAADRRSIVNVLAAGYDETFILDALAGRAEKCRKAPRWREIDTADTFLRITWLCSDLRRLQEAERVGAMLKSEPESPVIVGKDGKRYVHGMQIHESTPEDPNAPLPAGIDYDALGPNQWLKPPGSKK